MKVIAMYLPQFHRVKENDMWWGEGFTDWIAAQNATPLFAGHYQPHIPLNKNYYNLVDVSTLRWQESLLKKYGVDGLCIYHYWFKDGKKILEKPAELLLKNVDIDIPFCFSWANESWARSWCNIGNANTWSSAYEDGNTTESALLLRQDYGNIDDWKKHFEYLLPFFMDSRYMKVDNKPIISIYKVRLIPCIRQMLDSWKAWARESGFDGLYIIGSNCDDSTVPYMDKLLNAEPGESINTLYDLTTKGDVRVNSYDALWQMILSGENKKKKLYGGFVSYDETPRQGTAGVVVEGANPQKFGRYLTKLLAKNYANGNELVFLYAWNEWGEGNHLEPDERFGYEYLEQIRLAKNNYLSVKMDEWCENIVNNNYIVRQSNKYAQYYRDMDMWMSIREQGVSILRYLDKYGVSTFAIYGYGIMGRHLLVECEENNRKCEYLIDKQKNRRSAQIPIYSPDEKLPKVDAVIVSAYFYYDEICRTIPYNCISLGEMINVVFNDLF